MIVIMNRGACPRRAIELIGHTSKNGVNTIGRFGSGTAYAVALALRMGMTITISSHDEDGPYEVTPYLKTVMVGDQSARQVLWRYRRGSSLFRSWWESPLKALSRAWSVPTSFSAELGAKDWHGSFPVVREFVSNARDADPDFEVYLTDDHVETFLSKAQATGAKAVTVVRIENTLDDADEPEAYVENWGDNFRWGKHNDDDYGEIHRVAMSAIYAKSEVSPLKLFVRGVRCPWPGDVPMSMYDYSLDLELTEARTIKDQWKAAYRMTQLWADAPPSALLHVLSRLPGTKCWESDSMNEFVVASKTNMVVDAWESVHGKAPVASDVDPVVPGSVRVEPALRAFLANNGVPTAKSRTVTISHDTEGLEENLAPPSTIVVPSEPESMVIELTMVEANELLRVIYGTLSPVLSGVVTKLTDAGAKVVIPDEITEEDLAGSAGSAGSAPHVFKTSTDDVPF